jgi:predicted nucleic acid-binding protein
MQDEGSSPADGIEAVNSPQPQNSTNASQTSQAVKAAKPAAAAKNAKTVKPIEILDALLFVDTNVLLDFYRIRNSDISLEYLKQLEACKDRLIITSQVEMEYKKNRQEAIIESLNSFGSPDWNKLSGPAIVTDLQAMKMIRKQKEEITKQQKKVNEKIHMILKNPINNDPVYQCLQRLFKHKSNYNLSREKSTRFRVRNLAKKRFVLGYPPRKKNDTSIGDSVNWEWIVQCAIDSGKHIIIVTRDKDYGVIYKGNSFLNDWLRQEFSERVSRKRKIILTEKLAMALKLVHAAVTKEMEDEEDRIIAEQIDGSLESSVDEA